MPIEFTCQNCETTLRVPDEHAGKQAKCPRCQTLNLIQAGVQIRDSNVSTHSSEPIHQIGNFGAVKQPGVSSSANPYHPTGAPGVYQVGHRGGLILTLGILGIACNFFGIPGIMAWVLGRADLKQMDAGVMDVEGRGMVQAGMILGIIGTVLAVLGILFYGFFVAIMIFGAVAAG